MLKFRKAGKEEKDAICSLTQDTLKGAVAFCSLAASSPDIPDRFLLGVNENGEIKSIVFDTGDEYFLVFGNEFPEILSRCEKIIMIYNEKSCKPGRALPLHGKEILSLYKLLSGKDALSFDDERRYVLRLRGVNSGYAAVFGISEAGRLVSAASVASENEKYALIADVFTEEKHRGRGLARECLMTVTDYILKRDKIPVLLCDEKMCTFYEKAGFEIYGKM